MAIAASRSGADDVPEGDTIHRAAAALRNGLQGSVLTDFRAPRAAGVASRPEPGERIEAVEARGKHLLIRFEGGTTVHTHMRMTGTWRINRPGKRRRAARSAAVTIVTDRAIAECIAAPIVELLDDHAVRRHPVLSSLGPDLCLPDPDLAEVMRRLDRIDSGTEIGVALLEQRVACGIGNVYKSEVAFARRVDPFTPLADLDAHVKLELWRTGSDLLRRNLGPGPRRTVSQGLAVYDRAGRPCYVCGGAIAVRRQGEAARPTWWCPGCQSRSRPSAEAPST
jgi:endonuclease-8